MSARRVFRVPRSDGSIMEGARKIGYDVPYVIVEWTLDSGKTQQKRVYGTVFSWLNGGRDFVDIDNNEVLYTGLIHETPDLYCDPVGSHWEVINKKTLRLARSMYVSEFCRLVNTGVIPFDLVKKDLEHRVCLEGECTPERMAHAKTLAQHLEETIRL